MFGFTARFVLTFVFVTSLLVGGAAYLIFEEQKQSLLQSVDSQAQHHFQLAGQGVSSAFNAAARDIHFLTHVPDIREFLSHQSLNRQQPDAALTEKIEQLASAYLSEHLGYFQLRLVSPAGMELFKITAAATDSTRRTLHETPAGMLQDKSGRDYIQASRQLREHQTYFSPISYNREFGQLEYPLRPTVRAAAPVVEGNKMLGLVLLNIDVNYLLDQVHSHLPVGYTFSLRSQDGLTLATGPKAENGGEGLPASSISADQVIKNVDASQRLRYIATIPSAPQQPLLETMLEIDSHQISHQIAQMGKHIILFTLLTAVCCTLVIIVLSRHFVAPLAALTAAMRLFPKVGFAADELPTARGDEVGILARAFVDMKRQISVQHQDLKESEQRFKAISENIIDGVLIINAKGIIEFCNPATGKLFELPVEQLVGQNISCFIPEPHRSQHDLYLQRYVSRPHAGQVVCNTREVEAQTSTGRLFPAELSVTQFTIKGEPLFVGTLRDVSTRKATERQLQQAHDELELRVAERTEALLLSNQALSEEIENHKLSQRKLLLSAEIIRSTSEAVVVSDADNVIVDVNDAYCHITGFEREEIIGQSPSSLKSGRHDDAFYAQMWDQLNTEGFWKGEIWDRRKNGEVYPKWLTINVVRDSEGHVSNYVGVFSDISELKTQAAELQRLAHFDPLTQLPNRLLFRERVEQKLKHAARSGRMVALMFIDLDHFKHINDSLGHAAGDDLLVEVGRRLVNCLREVDVVGRSAPALESCPNQTIARLGGDEFTIALGDLSNLERLSEVIERVLTHLRQPILLDGRKISINASIGVSVYPADGMNYDELTRNADIAMYRSKEAGRGQFMLFTQEMNIQAHKRLELEIEMRASLASNDFQLYYQPKICARRRRLSGMEALIRWNHPRLGLVSPLDFISIAEDTGMIIPLGEWILQQACIQCAEWNRIHDTSLQVAVNISARQFNDPDFLHKVSQALEISGLPASQLELEITESLVIGDIHETLGTIRQLRKQGVAIALDDFGTGYSSLSYLKILPINTLKIDRSFIAQLDNPEASVDQSIVETIIRLGQQLKMKIVAEGVETADHDQILRKLDCDQLQGFFYSRPLPAEEFNCYLAADVLAAFEEEPAAAESVRSLACISR